MTLMREVIAAGTRYLTSACEQRRMPAKGPQEPKQNCQDLLAGLACVPTISTAFTLLPTLSNPTWQVTQDSKLPVDLTWPHLLH